MASRLLGAAWRSVTGVVMLGPSAEVPIASVRQCFDANVFGLLELCQVSCVQPLLGLLQLDMSQPPGKPGRSFSAVHCSRIRRVVLLPGCAATHVIRATSAPACKAL